MKIVLVGNQNSGKTTIFNSLTGLNQKIGNWSGVTVDYCNGKIKNTNDMLVDLPGIYSLSPYSIDEEITVNYLNNYDYDLIINVIDINVIERSLILTYELLKLNKPILIIFTHTDKYNQNELIMNKKVINEELKLKVIEIDDIININNFNIKSYEHNNYINIFNNIDKIIKKMKIKNNTNYLDKLFLNRLIGIPLFLVIMLFIYLFSIYVGNYTNNFVDNMIQFISNGILLLLNRLGLYKWLVSLMIDGILKGISVLICFIPQLFIMFFLIEILNQTGYISRIAYLFYVFFNRIGLSGTSIIPFICATNCSVPGIMQSRIIENKNIREKTIVLTTFIPCSAKIPIIIMISNYLNIKYLIIIIYVLIIIIMIIYALILNKIYKKDTDYMIMELPNYKLPNIKYIFKESIFKIKDFIKKITSIIIISSIILWLVLNITFNNYSLLFYIGNYLSFIFYPFLGSKNWILSISILEGLISRENVISSLNIIGNLNMFGYNTLLSFLIFNLFSIPCFNTIIIMRQELGIFKLIIYLFFQFVIAFILSTLIYRLGIL